MRKSRVRGQVAIWATLAAAAGALGACAYGSSEAARVQNWQPREQTEWYTATQGSRLMPLAWLKALEQAGSDRPFAADDHLARFRLLPRPGGLPVGFAIDDNDDDRLTVSKLRWFAGQGTRERWVGLNCSACHTGEIAHDGQTLRIDGGPSLFDYQSFVEALDAALVATRDARLANAPKWDRFAKAVLAGRDTPANRALLGTALDRLVDWEARVERLNDTPLRYGYGRVDAFGHIFNKVALFSGAPNPVPNPASAPVSYPHLWDIYRHDRLQWNGIVANERLPLGGEKRYLDYGALGRNSGEVIGVFGDVAVTPGSSLAGYRSSIWADNLIRLETQLSRLRAPQWPQGMFGKLDDTPEKKALLADGRALFGAHCQSCHAPQPGTGPYKVTMLPLRRGDANATDPWMACNAISYRSPTGRMEGTKSGYIGKGDKLGADAPLAEMLETLVKGAMVGKKGQIVGQTARVFFGVGGAPRVVTEETPDFRGMMLDACYASNSPFFAYKARPLDGIWATAPYLHNGSVASLAQLLLPPAQRMTRFNMGTREYDPATVGYRTDAAPGNGFTYDTRLAGNSNAGHDYGASTMTPPQRAALLQYLKSL